MRGRFFQKLSVYLLPFLVVLGFPFAVMFTTGELASVEDVLEWQAHSPFLVLFGLAYSDPCPFYKLRGVLRRQPHILALGTSRVLALRSEFFRPDADFFNAGNGVTRLRHYRAFLDRIPRGQEPRILLLGLDQYFYNAAFDSLALDGMEAEWSGDRDRSDLFFAYWRRVYLDWAAGKISLRRLAHRGDLHWSGLTAGMYGNGFRNDGSYSWARHAAQPDSPDDPDYGFSNTHDRIAKGNRRFEHGEKASEASLRETGLLLEACKARGIHVVGFLPPFAHVILEEMLSRPKDYGYLRELKPKLDSIFARAGFPLRDFSDLAALGASDRETVDGYHGSEKAYLRLFIHLAEADSSLRAWALPIARLEELLARSGNPQVVFATAAPR
jgi:hypothetical protein